jgi:thiosulfate/3-mercaptopyruvate sulfurtransferase
VIVYACGLLPYAARAWWVLRHTGHDHVRVLNGGLSAWKNAGGKTEQAPRRYEPAIFRANPRPDMFAAKEEVLAALEDRDVTVLDVLPPASYEGAHIPGSANLSCMDLMQGMDYFLPDDRLAVRLQETSRYQRIITYCGGGIAAALSAMAHLMVGQEHAAVYDGSLDEWIGEGLPLTGTGEWAIWEA